MKFAELTKREKEIINLIAYEYTTNEIAEKLFVSADTVKTHRRNIFIKLSVKNIAGAVRIGMENNLVSASELSL